MGARPQQNPTARYNISIVCYLPLFSLPLYLHLTVSPAPQAEKGQDKTWLVKRQRLRN